MIFYGYLEFLSMILTLCLFLTQYANIVFDLNHFQ